ncbi:hypothetical protein QR680_001620 [Steinernema hermaphroditum]|uniref:Uncharacterized protein n=1 Tax=Steinernema hermaphroditum TaxID=289476 RepID=A0AA39H131_9BILA|nr:hypothetical protein QR680_001620 [Steinernema hermaphroditum]
MQRRDEQRLEKHYSRERVDAALEEHELEYKHFRNMLGEAHILLDNVVLSQLAIYEPKSFKGVTASYMGISETMIQFVLYEYFRQIVDDRIGIGITKNGDKKPSNFISCMVSGGVAKFFACVIAYPHEVVRTRLREENTNTKGFFSTLYKLYREGYRSMYRGLGVQLMRTVPNTAITLGTYELVVYVLHQLKND